MASIKINLSDVQLQKLEELARLHGVAVEELLRVKIEGWLSSQDSEFSDAVDYVLTKNADLYRRLS